MIKLERTSVMNLENAMRGARNPMNSWARSDSGYDENGNYISGPTSTMHKIHSKPFEEADFSTDHISEEAREHFLKYVAYMEEVRLKFIENKDKALWYILIQLLPSSYNQLRTCTLNYETLANIYNARKHHKLEEWHTMCEWIEGLPYAADLVCYKEEK